MRSNEGSSRTTISKPFLGQSDSDSEIELGAFQNTATYSPTSSVLDVAKVFSNPDDISITSFPNENINIHKTPTTPIRKKTRGSNPTPRKYTKRKSNASLEAKPIAAEDHQTSPASLDQGEKRFMRQRMDEMLCPLNTQSIDTPYFYPTPWGYYPIMLQPIQNITAREDLLSSMNGPIGANQATTANKPQVSGGFIPLSKLPPPGVIPPQFSNYLLHAAQTACFTPVQGTPSIPSRGGSTRTSFDSSSSMSSAAPYTSNIIPMPMTPLGIQTPSRCACAECCSYYPNPTQTSMYW
jgi:hypothetical protein